MNHVLSLAQLPAEHPAAFPVKPKGNQSSWSYPWSGENEGRGHETYMQQMAIIVLGLMSVTQHKSTGSHTVNVSIAYRAICSLKPFVSVEIPLMKLHILGLSNT